MFVTTSITTASIQIQCNSIINLEQRLDGLVQCILGHCSTVFVAIVYFLTYVQTRQMLV